MKNNIFISLILFSLIFISCSSQTKSYNKLVIINAKSGNVQNLKKSISLGGQATAKDNNGFSALMHAINGNHLDAVKLLVVNKANVNYSHPKTGLTPLILASGRGYSEIGDFLISKGANVKQRDKFGMTALMTTSMKGHIDSVKLRSYPKERK